MEHRRIQVRGTVQGVGFRPFVWRSARDRDLQGWVRNCGADVEIEICGPEPAIIDFINDLRHPSLPRAVIDEVIDLPAPSSEPIPLEDARGEFKILESSPQSGPHRTLPPDAATCRACLDEMKDPTGRRCRYPFIQCNDCGPRFTIIESLPFDRARTTMAPFAMCPDCEREYRDPKDRRFHCQTISCPACGPELTWMSDNSHGPDAIRSAVDAVQRGRIIAIQGIGGFHLACDARNDEAVGALRDRKGRGDKPLAIMVVDLAMARTLAQGSTLAWQTLEEWTGPIVVLPKNRDGILSPRIAPGVDSLGILLPYSPIHHLLMQRAQAPWVMTSGNRSDEPIAIDPDEAVDRLSGIADGFLIHNRRIVEMCDDSVVRVHKSARQTLRRARGMVPASIEFDKPSDNTLATGADLKGTFCLVRARRAYVSQPFGDMENRETFDSLQRTQNRWEQWLDSAPVRIVCDLHPGYHASHWAQTRAARLGIEPLRIQHHHAHVGALAAEHRWDPEQPLLSFVFDGTGYGTDGTIWGGEAVALRDRQFHRTATLEPFPLLGGDAAIRFPYRAALALLHHAGIPWSDDLACVNACAPDKKYLFKQLLDRGVSTVATTSMGRLFDGVASLLGVRHAITYEAQAAIELEVLAATENGADCDIDAARWLIDAMNPSSFAFPTARCVLELVDRLRCGASAATLARWFHAVIAQWTLRVAVHERNTHGIAAVGLTGGVFQNALLSTLAVSALESHGFQVLRHESWPCHDGSIALGQAWIACHLSKYPR